MGQYQKTDNWRYSSLQSVELAADDVVEEPTEEEEPPDPRYVVETYTTQIPPSKKRQFDTGAQHSIF
ncbi:MAG: hypothetical protein CM15mP83_0710 [Flavobacteriaceae bacterium]|nr:MAG: hypothetical protein CM15mP83_0710 [Flavobacteriaceae bacterium]